jgi:hypothetical protein
MQGRTRHTLECAACALEQNSFRGDAIMKYKRIASLLALAIASGAHSLNPAPPSASGKAVQAPCAGDDAASTAGKGNHCMHPNAFGSGRKEAMSCCPVNDASQTGSCCREGMARPVGKPAKTPLAARAAMGLEVTKWLVTRQKSQGGNQRCGEHAQHEQRANRQLFSPT